MFDDDDGALYVRLVIRALQAAVTSKPDPDLVSEIACNHSQKRPHSAGVNRGAYLTPVLFLLLVGSSGVAQDPNE